MWTLDDIIELNATKPSYSPQVSNILKSGAAYPNLLTEIAAELDQLELPHVACFCQLPYPIFVEDKWLYVRTLDIGLRVKMKIRPIQIQIEENVTISVSPLFDGEVPQSSQNNEAITGSQIVALVPLWGSRLEFYPRYVSTLIQESRRQGIVVPLERSWIPGRAMTTADFEQSMFQRMRTILIPALRNFLPSYSILSLSEAPLLDYLYSYFLMPAPGRVYFGRPPRPFLVAVNNHRFRRHTSVPHERLQQALSSPFREITNFERQLIAMNKLRQEGELALSLIGTLALLEWFVNTYFIPQIDSSFVDSKQKSARQEYLYKIITSGRMDAIDPNLRQIVLDSIKIRNTIAHGAPVSRTSLTDPQRTVRRAEEPSINAQISDASVEKIIRASFEIYRTTNLLTRSK